MYFCGKMAKNNCQENRPIQPLQSGNIWGISHETIFPLALPMVIAGVEGFAQEGVTHGSLGVMRRFSPLACRQVGHEGQTLCWWWNMSSWAHARQLPSPLATDGWLQPTRKGWVLPYAPYCGESQGFPKHLYLLQYYFNRTFQLAGTNPWRKICIYSYYSSARPGWQPEMILHNLDKQFFLRHHRGCLPWAKGLQSC